MNPEDPEAAQRIVADYAAVLKCESEQEVYPSSVEALPYPKQTIKAAIRTCVQVLASSGRLTQELRDFLEIAYMSLADYVEEDVGRLLTEFCEAGDTLAVDGWLARDKVGSPAWNRLTESARLAGDIANLIERETQALRQEFSEIQG